MQTKEDLEAKVAKMTEVNELWTDKGAETMVANLPEGSRSIPVAFKIYRIYFKYWLHKRS